jgi:hypothetical protein
MKKYLLILTLTIFSFSFSQIKTPQPSPAAKIVQIVGLTEIEVQYSRPSMRGREIFGNLVPYDKIWRTGANENSVISFSTSVKIGDSTVPAGKYSIYTIPGVDSWDFILYSDANNWGLPSEWDENKVIVKRKILLNKLCDWFGIKDLICNIETVESFQFSMVDLSNNSFTLGIDWGDVYIPITIDIPTREMVEKNIQDVMGKQPKASDYYAAAVYYRQENINIEKAVEWIDKAIEMSEEVQYWQLRQQSLIYAANGNIKGAIKVAKKALEAAKIANNKDYVKMNKDSIEEWSN